MICAVAQHDDPIGVAHRRKPVGDHDAGAPAQHRIQPRLDLRFGKRVDAGSGLVQQQDRWILQQHARQRHQLPLAERKPRAALADIGVQALRQIVDPAAVAELARRRRNLLIAGVGPAVANIVGHCAREQKRHLRHQPKLAAILAPDRACEYRAHRSAAARPETRRSA